MLQFRRSLILHSTSYFKKAHHFHFHYRLFWRICWIHINALWKNGTLYVHSIPVKNLWQSAVCPRHFTSNSWLTNRSRYPKYAIGKPYASCSASVTTRKNDYWILQRRPSSLLHAVYLVPNSTSMISTFYRRNTVQIKLIDDLLQMGTVKPSWQKRFSWFAIMLKSNWKVMRLKTKSNYLRLSTGREGHFLRTTIIYLSLISRTFSDTSHSAIQAPVQAIHQQYNQSEASTTGTQPQYFRKTAITTQRKFHYLI